MESETNTKLSHTQYQNHALTNVQHTCTIKWRQKTRST